MQEVYRIQATACFKPWRYSNTYYTTNKAFFEYLRDQEGEELDSINFSDFLVTNPEIATLLLNQEYSEMSEYVDEDTGEKMYEDVCRYSLFDAVCVEVSTPYVCLGELELYTE